MMSNSANFQISPKTRMRLRLHKRHSFDVETGAFCRFTIFHKLGSATRVDLYIEDIHNQLLMLAKKQNSVFDCTNLVMASLILPFHFGGRAPRSTLFS